MRHTASFSSSTLTLSSPAHAVAEKAVVPDTANTSAADASEETITPLSIQEEKEHEDEITYPDGGFQSWTVVFGSWCAMFGAFGIWNSEGSFQAYLTENQLSQYNESTVSWIFSVFSFLFFFCGVQVGPLFDRYGVTVLAAVGSVGFIVSLMMFSLSTEYYQYFLSFGILGGISCSFIFTPAISCISHWFLHRRGFAIGIAATGGGFGGVVIPLAVRALIPKVGFAWTIRIVGFIVLLTSIFAVICMKSRLTKTSGSAQIDLRAFRDKRFAMFACANFMVEWSLQIPQTYFTSYALAKGIDETLSYQLIAIMNGASILGRLVPGYAADKIGRFNMLIMTIALSGLLTLGVWLPAAATSGHNTGAAVAYFALFGFASGSGISLAPVCLTQICDIREYGTRYGTCFSFASLGTLTGMPIAGQLVKRMGGRYEGLIAFSGGCYMVATAFYIISRGFSSGWKLKTVF
ncbi:major facilitator superfamily domain-containing protein [Limtongia smithiae]|uniref:major facilitator superfamily domain-containing protein n=1 Tax=Limtongia smithiae TaxID=1125753 RepID=UPI0034CEA442